MSRRSKALAADQPCEGRCETVERKAPIRNGTAVDAGDRAFETDADQLFDGLANALLYGMLRKFIMSNGLAEMTGGQKHRGMFAGTVVVKPRRIRARTKECAPIVDAERKSGAASQVIGGEAGAFEQATDDRDVAWRSAVGCARDRKFAIGHLVSVRGPRLDQGKGLNDFDRGPREYCVPVRACDTQDIARSGRDNECPGMAAFQLTSSRDFDKCIQNVRYQQVHQRPAANST